MLIQSSCRPNLFCCFVVCKCHVLSIHGDELQKLVGRDRKLIRCATLCEFAWIINTLPISWTSGTPYHSWIREYSILIFKLIRSAATEYYISTYVVFHTWGHHVHLCINNVTMTLYIVLIFPFYLLIYYLFISFFSIITCVIVYVWYDSL